VGAGPIGIASGIEAARRGYSHLILEKGCLTDAIYRFPPHLVFFSSPSLLELGGVPFVTSGQKATREEVLYYYRRLTEHFRLNLRLYEAAAAITAQNGPAQPTPLYEVRSNAGELYRAPFVILAIGFYDHPNLLGIPGEELPKVSHYYREAHPYFRQKVAVVGGQNSAVEAALELYRSGAEVTLIHRGPELGSGVKYWIRPDIDNRIKEGAIRAFFKSEVTRIEPGEIVVRGFDGAQAKLENDFVLALTGYHTDYSFLKSIGVQIDPETLKPTHDPSTMETNLPQVYVAGVAAGGKDANKIFIENSRVHAEMIFKDIETKSRK